MPRPMTEEEILELVNRPKIDLSKPVEFLVLDATEGMTSPIDSKGKEREPEKKITIKLYIPELGDKQGEMLEWLMPDSEKPYSMLKVRRFMCAIGLEESYMNNNVSARRILSKDRKGLVILDYVDNAWVDDKTGALRKNKKYVIKEFVKSLSQEKFEPLGTRQPEFTEDTDIPF